MPWNGSGTYSPPAASFPEVNGTVIDAGRYNPTINDLAAGITNCLAKDGQNAATANIPMGGFKLTGAANAAAGGEFLVWGQTLSAAAGTAGAPGVGFNGDADTGSFAPAANTYGIATGGTERLRVTSAGSLSVGTSTPLSDDPGKLTLQTTGENIPLWLAANSASGGKYWKVGPEGASNAFVVYNQANTGVFIANGATSWTASSDERLKTALTPFTSALAKITTLRAGTGRYLTDAPGVTRSFLIAQDVQAVLPEAVTSRPDGMLGLSYTDLIPLLVAALKEVDERLTAAGH